MSEIWKEVKDYEGHYQVSSLGRVKSLARLSSANRQLKEKILKASLDKHGYYLVSLCKDGNQKTRTVHQLVAESFLNHTSCGYKLVINHIDFNPLNNRIDNLEIVTARKNTNRKHLKSTSVFTGVCWHKKAQKWLSRIRINGKLKHLGTFTSELEASKAYQTALKNLN